MTLQKKKKKKILLPHEATLVVSALSAVEMGPWFGLLQSLLVFFAFSLSLLSLPHSSDSPACLRTRTGFPTPLQNRGTNLGFCLVCVLGHVHLLDFHCFDLLQPVPHEIHTADSTETQYPHITPGALLFHFSTCVLLSKCVWDRRWRLIHHEKLLLIYNIYDNPLELMFKLTGSKTFWSLIDKYILVQSIPGKSWWSNTNGAVVFGFGTWCMVWLKTLINNTHPLLT